MKKIFFILLAFLFGFQNTSVKAQDTADDKNWKIGGALGLDLSQIMFINPKFGSGIDRIGIGGNLSFFIKYHKERVIWNNTAGLAFGIQRLGRGKELPFQKAVDELRLTSNFSYGITPESPFGYSMDVLFLSQITPTYDGNYMSRLNNTGIFHPISKFLSPATLTVSPGIAYNKKTKLGEFFALLSPASLKMVLVTDDSIAMLGRHGNPYSAGVTEQGFKDEWKVSPSGTIDTNTFYANNYIQFGATLKAGYKHKLFKYQEGGKDKHRLVVSTTINLFSNYLRDPQNIDVEWITNVDLYLFKGLSISLMTNLFYDYDMMVQVDADNDLTTGVNGYEATERRVSFMEQLLIKYNVMF